LPIVTPENIPEVLTGIAAIVTSIGGWTLWRVWREPPKPGTVEAVLEALTQNTAAIHLQSANFADNNKMFSGLTVVVTALLKETEEQRRATEACREHLAAIRDAENRRR